MRGIRGLAFLMAFLPACKLPGGDLEVIPGVSYGESLSGPDGSYAALSLTFVPTPQADPGVSVYRPFLDSPGVDVPTGSDLALPTPRAGPASSSGPEHVHPPKDPEVSAHPPDDEAVTVDTPWGPIQVGGNVALLILLWYLQKRGVIPVPKTHSKESAV